MSRNIDLDLDYNVDRRSTILDLNQESTEELFNVLISGSNNLRDIRALLSRGANPNWISIDHGVSAMHLAAGKDFSITQLLLQFGGNPNIINSENYTPLHVASSWGDISTVEQLLQHGADANLQDLDGKTPYDLAEEEGQEKCASLLKSHIYKSVLENYRSQSIRAFEHRNEKKSITQQVFEYCSNDGLQNSIKVSDVSLLNNYTPDKIRPETDLLQHKINKQCYLPNQKMVSPLQKVADFILSSENFNRKCSISKTNERKEYLEAADTSFSSYTTCCEVLDDACVSPSLELRKSNIQKYALLNGQNTVKADCLECRDRTTLDEIDISFSETIKTPLKMMESKLKEKYMNISQDFNNSLFSTISVKDYNHHDADSDITFIERHLASDYSNDEKSIGESSSIEITALKSFCEVQDSSQKKQSHKDWNKCALSSTLQTLTCQEISQRLKAYGQVCGPITDSTKNIYLHKLALLETKVSAPLTSENDDYPPEMVQALNGTFDVNGLHDLELKLVESFNSIIYSPQWREGSEKSSFTYILLDPRITQNLPLRAKILSNLEVFKTFILAIFYIGKGKASRPYSHLYEAHSHLTRNSTKKSSKIDKIVNIWTSGLGVVSVHCFHSTIPVEAYTREACMIEAIGIHKLTNIKKGDFYGISSSWPLQLKRKMGVYLLQKSLQIFLSDGERQICLPDLKKRT
ncbi:ankyrin repeat and LEM domain-containing protein 1-like isoform X1 [Biomphalaria glabrata]|uniref:Ankyrin repeat and LEM domain-containing protein 1-like isoform X1 n=2 Tax=Biomphalaria glabrata TaxID=6526 RepID=A0A9W3BAJ0_BIOGL|nr:ankyrin repeat and LEM domain-containing protein 1-like isoform X1 [Biomphalaria glabrata]